jgi:endonuclease III
VGCSQGLVDQHGGEVPESLEALVKLPGVGRKTANVVMGSAFGKATGVVVDTHVGRISRRLAITQQTDPVRAGRDLVACLSPAHWIRFSHQLIEHGRSICTARKPRCESCPLEDLCPQKGVRKPAAGR